MKSNKFRSLIFIGVASLSALSITGTGFSAWTFTKNATATRNINLDVENYVDLDEFNITYDAPLYMAIEDPTLVNQSYGSKDIATTNIASLQNTGLLFLKEDETIKNNFTIQNTETYVSLLTVIDSSLTIKIAAKDPSTYDGLMPSSDTLSLHFGIDYTLGGKSQEQYISDKGYTFGSYMDVLSGFEYGSTSTSRGFDLFDTTNATQQYLVSNGLLSINTDETNKITTITIQTLKALTYFSTAVQNAISDLSSDENMKIIRAALRDVSVYGYESDTDKTIKKNDFALNLHFTYTKKGE